jgi:hypothetical protein
MIKIHKKTRPRPIKLPNSDIEIEKYTNNNRETIFIHIADCIDHAIDNSEDMVELFSFIGTQYYVILHNKDYLQSLEHVFGYFMENELYEHCQKIKNIKDKLVSFNLNIKTDYITHE